MFALPASGPNCTVYLAEKLLARFAVTNKQGAATFNKESLGVGSRILGRSILLGTNINKTRGTVLDSQRVAKMKKHHIPTACLLVGRLDVHASVNKQTRVN